MKFKHTNLQKLGFTLSLVALASPFADAMAQTAPAVNQPVAQTAPAPSPTPATPAPTPATPTPAPRQAAPAPTPTPAPATPTPAPRQAAPTPTPAPATPTPAPRQAAPTPTPAPQAAPNREAPFRPAAAPQSTTAEPQLYERASFINTCRSSGTQPITVSSDITRNNYVTTIQPYTRINLTGVIAYNNSGQVQYVQISQPALGYVPTATLLTNCDAGPTPTPTPTPGKGTCYTIRPLVAPYGLSAYDSPGGAPQRYPNTPTGKQDGPAANSRIYFTNPATPSQDYGGRTFVKVYYTSLGGSERLGWVSQGTVGSVAGQPSSNFAPCTQ